MNSRSVAREDTVSFNRMLKASSVKKRRSRAKRLSVQLRVLPLAESRPENFHEVVRSRGAISGLKSESSQHKHWDLTDSRMW